MVPYKCLTSPQKTISALRPPQHEPTRWDNQDVKTWYRNKKQNIYPLEYHRDPFHTTSTIHTTHPWHVGQHFNHDSYKQEAKTSQHKQWQKIPIKVSWLLRFNPCNFSILPLKLTSSNFLTLQIYHCVLSILIRRGKSTKARRMTSLKAMATQAFCRVQPLTPPKPITYSVRLLLQSQF